MSSTLHLSITPRAARDHVPFLRRHLRRAHAILRPSLRELSVALVGDARMSHLHLRFMNIPGPTDVLTFPLEFDAHRRPASGEVIVCVPEARRQAARHGNTLRVELLLYALHGMLHLCGFDDRTPAGYRKMHHMEDRLLAALGVGPAFAPDRPPTRMTRPSRR